MVCTCEGRGTCTACRLAEALNAGMRLNPPHTPGHAHAAKVARQARLARGQWTDAGNGLEVRLG